MKLHFKIKGEGDILIILHGLFGSLDNWQTMSNKLSERYKVYCIDLRNHGKSPHSTDMTYKLMVDDVLELMYDEKLDSCNICGHSMGGKVAMKLALTYPSKVNKLIVADMAPVQYDGSHEKIFEGLLKLDLSKVYSRNDADDFLKAFIPDDANRMFIMKGLARNELNNFYWKFNVQALWNNYQEILSGVYATAKFNGEVLFIKGALSKYITEVGEKHIADLFNHYCIYSIANAGHWVHADAPSEFYEQVISFLA